MKPHKKSVSNLKFFVISALWILTVVSGYFVALRFQNTEGQKSSLMTEWPKESSLQRTKDYETLLVFAHPHCSCSKATLYELERLIPKLKPTVQIKIVFSIPKGKDLTWAKSKLYLAAQKIPRAEVVFDENLNQAKIFDARTSGQTFLYDKQGALLFSGGITPGRGHAGDSAAREFFLTWAEGNNLKPLGRTPVFGCSLDEYEEPQA